MKILAITSGYPDSTYTIKKLFVHDQNIAFIEEGCLVEVLNLNAIEESLDGEIYQSIKVYKLKKSANNLLKVFHNLKQLKKIFSNKKYDLVLYNGLATNQFLFFSFFKSISTQTACLVLGSDGMLDSKNIFRNLIRKIILKKLDWIFPISNFTDTVVGDLEGRTDKTAQKSVIAYCGFNPKKFTNVLKQTKKELRIKYDIPQDTYVVLTVCDLIPRKGVDILVRAMVEYAKKDKNFIHIIIGQGEDKEKILNYAKEHNILNNIRQIDYIADDYELVEYYRVSDVYCMLSKTFYNPPASEGFGTSYVEASYMGIPVIGGNNGGTSSSIKHNFTGYLVDPYSLNCYLDVSHYLLVLQTDKEEYERLSKNGQYMASKEFTWNDNVKTIIKTIKESKK